MHGNERAKELFEFLINSLTGSRKGSVNIECKNIFHHFFLRRYFDLR